MTIFPELTEIDFIVVFQSKRDRPCVFYQTIHLQFVTFSLFS